MLYDNLYELSVVGQTNSLAEAAKRLGVSQATLGRHLSNLESQLGVKLVMRSREGTLLTYEGRYALRYAIDVKSITDRVTAHFARGEERIKERTLKVAAPAYLVDSGYGVLEQIRGACFALNSSGYAIIVKPLACSDTAQALQSALTRKEVDVVLEIAIRANDNGTSYIRPCSLLNDEINNTFNNKRKPINKVNHRDQSDQLVQADLREIALYAAVTPDDPINIASNRDDGVMVSMLRGRSFVLPDKADPASIAAWEALNMLCKHEGFVPRLDSHSPTIIACIADKDVNDKMLKQGRVLVPVHSDSGLFVRAVVRADDAVACDIITRACDDQRTSK